MNVSPLLQRLSDDGLDAFATSESQPTTRRAVVEHGSITAAATALGVHRRSVERSCKRLLAAASRQGYAPSYDQTHAAPPGQSVKGVSTLYDADGAVKAQWVKTRTDQDDLREQLRTFVDELCSDITPAVATPAPELDDDDTLAVYALGDPHLGLMAWGQESGENHDLDIASRDLRRAVETLVQSTPPSATAIVLPLGDTLHADNSSNTTPQSGNPLDVDGRHSKVLRVAARLMLDVIELSLKRHSKVIVRVVEGNHDIHSSMALSLIIDAFYHNETRVTVDVSPRGALVSPLRPGPHRRDPRPHEQADRPGRHHGGRPPPRVGPDAPPAHLHRAPAQPADHGADRRGARRGDADAGGEGRLALGAGLPRGPGHAERRVPQGVGRGRAPHVLHPPRKGGQVNQSRKMSAVEAVASTVAGFAINVTLQTLVFPLFGVDLPLSSNLLIGAIFTGSSLARGYVLRRVFETFRRVA